MACPGVPFVTILTDIADYPPHFWIERQEQYVICGSDRAAAQARAIGLPESRVLQVSGMILNPKFYAPVRVDRAAARKQLGLQPDLPTGLVLFGGEGSSEMVQIARALNTMQGRLQLILLCGKNRAVAGQLRAIEHALPMHVEGFTRDVPFYMDLADFFIGKPGPGAISEALAKKLPVIVQSNAWTMAHERYNADWVKEQEVGIVVRSFAREIKGAVRALLEPANYGRFHRRAAALHNHAVYEIPEILEKILGEQAGKTPLPAATIPAAGTSLGGRA